MEGFSGEKVRERRKKTYTGGLIRELEKGNWERTTSTSLIVICKPFIH
jgi:DNA polymerase elongation subunit (family B)